MSYYELTLENILRYLQSRRLISNSNVEVAIIESGNMNRLFRINTNARQYICKQALPYIRCLGKSFPLTETRIDYETAFYKVLDQHASDFLPKIYDADNDNMKTIIMEDLQPACTLREGMMQNMIYRDMSEAISSFIVKMYHSPLNEKTSIYFANNPLINITEKYCFEYPFQNGSKRFSTKFYVELDYLKNLFLQKKMCLLHGDLHTGSIMSDGASYYVIDPEFAMIGPISFDIGNYFAHLLFMSIAKEKESLLDEILKAWAQLKDQLPLNTTTLLQETLGFMGIEILRRTLGPAPVAEMKCLPKKEKLQKEVICLRMGTTLVEERQHFKTMDKAIEALCLIAVYASRPNGLRSARTVSV